MATGFRFADWSIPLIFTTKFGIAIPGSTITHSELLLGAMIQQLVPKKSATTRSTKTPKILSSPFQTELNQQLRFSLYCPPERENRAHLLQILPPGVP